MWRMGEQRDLMLSGAQYYPGDAELTADRARAALLTERYNATGALAHPERTEILRELLGHLGEDVTINPTLRVDYGYPISIGDRTFINYDAILMDCARITIGADVQIGPRVQLVTALHPLDPALRRTLVESAQPITVGDGVWLASGAIVCPGVTIGANTVVGAGSVVVKDLPAGVLAVGNPCRVVRQL
jgi:maltose O-acetyltransferase